MKRSFNSNNENLNDTNCEQENLNLKANYKLDESLTGEEMPISKRLRSKKIFTSIRDEMINNNNSNNIETKIPSPTVNSSSRSKKKIVNL